EGRGSAGLAPGAPRGGRREGMLARAGAVPPAVASDPHPRVAWRGLVSQNRSPWCFFWLLVSRPRRARRPWSRPRRIRRRCGRWLCRVCPTGGAAGAKIVPAEDALALEEKVMAECGVAAGAVEEATEPLERGEVPAAARPPCRLRKQRRASVSKRGGLVRGKCAAEGGRAVLDTLASQQVCQLLEGLSAEEAPSELRLRRGQGGEAKEQGDDEDAPGVPRR
ncbi:unnamed protein product, partial [Prorocentrum cordatum]